MKNRIKYLLFVLPVILLIVCFLIKIPKYNNDPDYAYLLNSLNNAYLKTTGHTDHPGTTIQVAGAIVLRITHFFDFSTSNDLQTEVLTNPDFYISVLNRFFLFLNVLAYLIIGLLIYKLTKNIWLSILIQFTPFYTGIIIEFFATKVTPEQFITISSLLMIFQIIKYNYNPKDNIRNVIVFSLISGFGIATKVTFLPLVVIPIIIIPSNRSKIYYFIGTILSTFIFTIPIISKYHDTYHWLLNILTHKGIYGHGENGIIDSSIYLDNIIKLAKSEPILYIFISISIIVIIVNFIFITTNKKFKYNISLKILIAITIADILNILIVAKHISSHYLLPSICLIGGNIFFIIICIENIYNEFKISINKYIKFVVVLIIVSCSFFIIPKIYNVYISYKKTSISFLTCKYLVENNYKKYNKIYFVPYSYNKFSALLFGNAFSNQKSISKIRKIYGDIYIYNQLENKFCIWNDSINIYNLNNNTILIGNPLDENIRNNIESHNINLTTIYEGYTDAIYRLNFKNNILDSFKLFCNSEKLTKDGFYFNSNIENYNLKNGSTQSIDKAHSGKYSCKLNPSNPYGMTFEIYNIHKGDNFNIKVWRYSTNNKGGIVASARNPKNFYMAGANVLEKDNNGWELVELKFTIPNYIKNNTLGIFLWNDSNSDVYFDDLTIIRN